MSLVKDEMTHKVAFVLESDDLESAHLAMDALEIHHVPVVRKGVVVGMLSDRDVLIHAHKRGKNLVVLRVRVGEVMSTPVVTCRPQTTIRAAADQMLEHGIHCLPVVDGEGKLVGIITNADLLRLLRDRGDQSLDEPLPFKFEQPCPLAPMFE